MKGKTLKSFHQEGKRSEKKQNKNILQTGTASMMCIDFVYKRVGTS